MQANFGALEIHSILFYVVLPEHRYIIYIAYNSKNNYSYKNVALF